jgi:hypothetical protein
MAKQKATGPTSKPNPFAGVKVQKAVAPAKPTPKPDAAAGAGQTKRQNFDYVPVIKMDFEPRAGLQTYTRELEERVIDTAEKPGEHVVYEVSVRMKPRVYQALLKCTLRRNQATQSPDWNEQDHLESWMKLCLEEELERMVTSSQPE